MKVNSVSNVYYRPQFRRAVKQNKPDGAPAEINFRGKFGKIVGGALGTGAVVAASFVIAPAAICLAGAGLLAGMVGGDVVEDTVNKNDNKDNDKGKNNNK